MCRPVRYTGQFRVNENNDAAVACDGAVWELTFIVVAKFDFSYFGGRTLQP